MPSAATDDFTERAMLENKKLLIFDLDGTLITSLGIWNAVDADMLARYVDGPVDVERLAAVRKAALARHASQKDAFVRYCEALVQTFGLPISGEAFHRARDETAREMLAQRVAWQPGAVDFIRAARRAGKLTAVATTTKRANV